MFGKCFQTACIIVFNYLLLICRIEGGSEKLWCMDFAGILMRGKAFFLKL